MHSSRMRTARSLIVSPYLVVSHARPTGSNHACISPEQPHMPPQEQPCMTSEQPCMPPRSNHTCPLGATTHTPPGATMHAPQEQPCMLPPGATMHAPPEQPCMPPSPRTPPSHTRPWPCMPPSHACPPPSHARPPATHAPCHERHPHPCGQNQLSTSLRAVMTSCPLNLWPNFMRSRTQELTKQGM